MRSLLLILVIVIIIVGAAIYRFWPRAEISMPEKNLANKKIVIVIAFRDFRDEEYFVPREILTEAGAEIKTASNKTGKAIGTDGGEVDVDLSVSEVNPAEFADLQGKSSHDSIQSISSFDAVVFIGGPGCLDNLDNENSYNLAKEAISENKALAAICVSPVILAKAGVLKGKNATVWSSPLDKSAINILKENGANYQAESVVVDGKIITANGPSAAEEFAQKIIEILSKK